ncbi:MAG: hypothetical protein JRJ48_01710 [Deltaproteobacteria bacterium]|nr:hypothetical protein [Deltaproteobacteria bacterium]
MEKKRLLKGAEAIGEAAIQTGCTRFYAYPVPNQSDLMEYLIQEENNGRGLTVFQAEDPLAAFFMAYGATIGGARVLTAVNSVDLPDALRAASYFSAADLPLVCIVFTQSGPGSGNIYPEQSDTLAALYGTRVGDGFAPVLTPSTPTDCVLATNEAFRLAETYHVPVFILLDAACAQLTETVDFSALKIHDIPKNHPTIKGENGGQPVKFTTLALDIEKMEERKEALKEKQARFLGEEDGSYKIEGDENTTLVVAFGIAAIQAKRALESFQNEENPCSLFEPTSLYPFPKKALQEAMSKANQLFILDMSNGQLAELLKPYIPEDMTLRTFSTTGGAVPRVEQIKSWIQQAL